MRTIDPSFAAIDVSVAVPNVEDIMAAWRDAREDTAASYAAWCRAATPHRRLAYAVFVAAAEREAVAERFSLEAVAHC